MKKISFIFFIFFIFFFSKLSAVEFKGNFKQGSFIIGQTQPGTEIWIDKKLIGGLLGIIIGSCFFGESMFSKITNI